MTGRHEPESDREQQLDEALAEYMRRLDACQAVDPGQFIQKYPQLAPDLRQLLESYRIQSVAFLDLFPQTGHLESVVQLLERGEAGGDES